LTKKKRRDEEVCLKKEASEDEINLGGTELSELRN